MCPCCQGVTHPLATAILRYTQSGVVGKLLDGIGQLASHACLGALVCFVPCVTGIDLHWNETQFPAVVLAVMRCAQGTS